MSTPSVTEALAAAVAALGDGEERPGQVAMAEAVAADPRRRGPPARAGRHRHRQVAGLPRALGRCTPPRRRSAWSSPPPRSRCSTSSSSRDLPRLADALEPVLGRRPTYAVLKGRHNYVCLDRLHRGHAGGLRRRRAVRRAHHRAGQAGQGSCASGPTTPRPATATTCRSPSTAACGAGCRCPAASAWVRPSAPTAQECFAEAARDKAAAVAGGHHQPRDARDPHARQRAGAARARRGGDRRGSRAGRPRDRGGERRSSRAR